VSNLANYSPRSGLSIPIVTVLDRSDRIPEQEQRAVIQYAVQDGAGADIIFAVGTNGEWNRLENKQRQAVFHVAVDECRKLTAAGTPVEAWLGVTAHSSDETLANLACSLELRADAVVLAPLSIRDVQNPIDFVEREVGGLFERYGRALPVFLYENESIVAPGKPRHLDVGNVAKMSHLDFIRGIKVTADREILGRFLDAAGSFRRTHEFPIYAGNAYLIFELAVRHNGDFPLKGIVCGPANMTPREWKCAWKATVGGDRREMSRYSDLLEAFRQATFFRRGSGEIELGIAALKTSLMEAGVISSDVVAPGTAGFEPAERSEFVRRLRELRARAASQLEADCLSRWG
jgi:dihydrodipicolinate synthase/N-acetylneuraminate lyase